MAEKFCLKWNDFDSNVSKSFGLLRNEDYLHDVTLVGDDNNQVPAHKLVLSACSEYFKNIFKNNKHTHPLLCIDGIASGDLSNIMDYIYNGEVKIFQDDLDRFLGIAQRLKLNGLIGSENSNSSESQDYERKESLHEQKPDLTSFSQEEIEQNSTYSPVTQPLQRRRRIRDTKTNDSHIMALNGKDNAEIDAKANEYLETLADGSLKCTFCGKTASQNNMKQNVRQNMKNHVETHLDGISFSCQLCGKDFRSRNSLSSHKSQTHK